MRIAVIGAGSWGTAMTGLAAEHADEVVLWARELEIVEGVNANGKNPVYLKDYQLSDKVRATGSMAEAATGADAVIIAAPSAFLRPVCHELAEHLGGDVPVLVLSKGIEPESHLLMHEVAALELGGVERIAALSGPNHAEEISTGTISAAVIASQGEHAARFFQKALLSPRFRAYVTDDIAGIEVCGAVKNVIAIACGAAVGLGCGDNTLAVLMTRGIAEISRIASAYGGRPITCMGLAGMGDLIVTCTSRHSRNRTFGEALVQGESLAEYEARTRMIVEGARAAVSVHELAAEKGIRVPISNAVYAMLYEGADADTALELLTEREPDQEFYGFAGEGIA